MGKTIEQCAEIHFCWKAGFNATKTFEMIQTVYGERAVHRATVIHWYKKSGRLMMTKTCENTARIADILKEDLQSSYRLITE